MKTRYNIPPLVYYPHLLQIIEKNHALIAGSTGGGKSVLLNAVIWSELAQPRINKFILIDTKRVELIQYKRLPHAVRYCQTLPETIGALEFAVLEIEKRYRKMERQRVRLWQGETLYIIIDELSDLVLDKVHGKTCTALLSKIARVGRACKVLLVACTQNANRAILKAEIVSNLPVRVAVRCNSGIESNQIIGTADATELEQGFALMRDGLIYKQINVPLIPDSEICDRVRIWTRQNNIWYQLKNLIC